MNPKISNAIHDGNVYKFTLSNINVSLANAIRRTMLSNIPTVVLNEKDCVIEENSSRFHNEFVKHRLSCIPVCEPNPKHPSNALTLVDKYELILNVKNDSDNIRLCTSEDFVIRNKETGELLDKSETVKIFPPDETTGDYILFLKLRPQISDTIVGENIKLRCDFSIGTSKQNGCFNVVSHVGYRSTPDITRITQVRAELENKYRSDGLSDKEIYKRLKNFDALDAERIYVENSYDFTVESIGIYDPKYIVKLACENICNKLAELSKNVENEELSITTSVTTIENCFDVHLVGEDYTIGKILEYILYNDYYLGNEKDYQENDTERELNKNIVPLLTYCGFDKFHPHDKESTLRIAFNETDEVEANQHGVRQLMKTVCVKAYHIYSKLSEKFK